MEAENAMSLSACSFPRRSSCPYLLIMDGNKQIFYDVLSKQYHTKFIAELCNKSILCFNASNDWMTLKDVDNGELSILNIVTMDKVPLPSPQSISYHYCILTLRLTDPRCHILLLNFEEPSKIWFCQPGDNEYIMQDVDDFTFSSSIVLSKVEENKFYCMDYLQFEKFIIVEFIDHKVAKFTHLKLSRFIDPAPLSMPSCESYIIEDDDGELLFIHKILNGQFTKEVYGFVVYKLDFSNRAWVQTKNIRERAIFLSADNRVGGAYIVEAKLGVEQNAIYFTESNDRCLYVYSLKNHTMSRSMPCPTVSCFPKDITWLHFDLQERILHVHK